MNVVPFTIRECVERHAMTLGYARGYADRSMHFRDAGDTRRAIWEQNAATVQYRIAREYLECIFILSGQSRTVE